MITMAGEDIEDGVIVIQDGRIAAIGKRGELETPWDAPVVGGPEFVAFPGFVEALSSRGMDRPNESVDVAPYLNIRDSIDPVNFYFEDCLRNGIVAVNLQQGSQCVIAGQGMVVRPVGMTVEEMMMRGHFGLAISASPKRGKSRATQAQALREAFSDLRKYLEEIVQDKRDGGDKARREALYQGREYEGEKAKGREMGGTAWKVDGLELIPRAEIDEKQEPLLELVEGRWNAFVYCSRPEEVHLALDVARDNGFLARTTLVLGNSCWKAADVIAEAGVPVVLSSNMVHIESDPYTGEETETFVPGVFHEKGVRFALASSNSTNRSLWYQAAMAQGLGLSRQVALEAVTTIPAEIIGFGNKVGSLEVGALGNVALFSGDPLSVNSFVEHVVLEGRVAYDRSEDKRFIHLYEGVEPAMAEPMAVVDDEEAGDDDESKAKDKKSKTDKDSTSKGGEDEDE